VPSSAVASRSHQGNINQEATAPWVSHFVDGSKGW
jgi:hypothetical protein